ncbi:hypothetical protein DFQ28_006409 [Apophysomyces sp. BC1034]|nr:hypothetical protein DFQ29_005093 [Apophysomyces sp. BC1021]KAG0187390.1 hypothetical protein DFQ28_006409 [Apophysomyces sp. BC1034]
MSGRPRRARKQKPTVASNAHYVGYVEDEESVEAIMKKFEELERMQKEFSTMAVKVEEVDNNETKATDATTTIPESDVMLMDDLQPLTEEQLQEVFKRTSAFTVKTAMIDSTDMEELDALEVWQMENKDGNTDEIYEEDDYIHVDDDFWDLEFGESPRPKRVRRGPSTREISSGGRRGVDRESIIAKYRIMKVQVQDRNGNYFMVKKRVRFVKIYIFCWLLSDPCTVLLTPAYRRMSKFRPDLSHDLGHIIYSRNYPLKWKAFQLAQDLKQFGTSFSAVYMDPPLLLPGEEPSPGKIDIDELAKLNVPEIVSAGFLFIWLEKEWLQRIVRIASKWGFKYVENFCWIKKNINNQIHRSEYTYFNKSKLSLLIFRKEGDIELRHQRNPDCVFDYVKPLLPDEVTEKKPAFMYDVIETLLPTAVYHPEKNPNGEGLLEL